MANIELRVAGIAGESIVDGPGIRLTVFLQGCHHHCEGCHNPRTWNTDGGTSMTVDDILANFDDNPLIKGLTISGGEPFLQASAAAVLASGAKALGKDVVVFTGYTLEELLEQKDPGILELLDAADYLVDGPFDKSLRDPELRFMGSSNQRFLDRDDMEEIRNGIRTPTLSM